MDTPRDYLEATQDELELIGEELEEFGVVRRRDFVFYSLVAAAASTFGLPRSVGGQAGTGAAAQAAPPAPFPLGNGEPISWTFQPWPGGTGALMEKLVRERGARAFERTPFTVERWSGAVPASDDDIAFLPTHRQAALIRDRRLTSTRLTRIYLERIKRLDPVLLCAVTIMENAALAEAAQADAEIAAGRYRGPLHGIPYGIKDLFSTRGVRTTWGSRDFENRVIDEDAEVVVRLRAAGAVLMAKLATGLFALGDQWYRGRTNNPWDVRRGSSGSSAGPGSATAAACVSFGIGTETSGSIVSPARENGISALRPTFGRVSRHGGMVLAWSSDRVGPMCRTVEDCAMVFHAIHGVDEKDPGTVTTPFQFDRNISLSSLRIGVDPGAAVSGAGRGGDSTGGGRGGGGGAQGAPPEFVEKLRELGMRPVVIGPRPAQLPGSGGFGVESAAAFDSYVQMKARELGIDVAAIPEPAGRGGGGGRGAAADSTTAAGRGGTGRGDAAAGAGRGNAGDPTGMAAITRWTGGRFPRAFDFIQGQRRRHVLITRWAEFMKDLDMFIGAPTADIGVNSQTGHPCVVVPYTIEPRTTGGGGGGGGGGRGGEGFTSNPMPTCAVIVGALYNDDKILSVAHAFQKATDVHRRRPNI